MLSSVVVYRKTMIGCKDEHGYQVVSENGTHANISFIIPHV